MKKEKLYLYISGFIIEISFREYGEAFSLINYFIASTKMFYKNFIINNPVKIDYRLEVIYRKVFKTLQSKTNELFFINFYEELSSKKCRTFYHISGIQLQVIIRKITHDLLLKHDGFILHASAVRKDNKAYIFLGDSGAGKSTIMTLLSPKFTPMGDDTIIIRKQKGRYYCYSTLAIEKNSWFPKDSDRIPLDKVFFLRKSKLNTATQLIRKEKIIALLGKQVYSDIDDLGSQFPNMTNFVNSFDRFYRLDFVLKDTVHLGNVIAG
jgi:hypothetical protein